MQLSAAWCHLIGNMTFDESPQVKRSQTIPWNVHLQVSANTPFRKSKSVLNSPFPNTSEHENFKPDLNCLC